MDLRQKTESWGVEGLRIREKESRGKLKYEAVYQLRGRNKKEILSESQCYRQYTNNSS